MKSPTPEAWRAERVFQIQSTIFGVNLLNNMFITQVRKSKDWQGFIFECAFHQGRRKLSDLQCRDYWNMHLKQTQKYFNILSISFKQKMKMLLLLIPENLKTC